jgi:hypothetical protein
MITVHPPPHPPPHPLPQPTWKMTQRKPGVMKQLTLASFFSINKNSAPKPQPVPASFARDTPLTSNRDSDVRMVNTEEQGENEDEQPTKARLVYLICALRSYLIVSRFYL